MLLGAVPENPYEPEIIAGAGTMYQSAMENYNESSLVEHGVLIDFRYFVGSLGKVGDSDVLESVGSTRPGGDMQWFPT